MWGGSTFGVDDCTGAWFTTLKCEEGASAIVVGDKCLLSSGLCEDEVLEWALPDPKAVVEDAKPQTGLWPTMAKGTKPKDETLLRCMQVAPQFPTSISNTYMSAVPSLGAYLNHL
jgi:hypothetical protein